MLKIIANSHELDLGSLKGITIKKNPGIFDNDSTDGSHIIPFSLDGSDINNIAFGFPYKMGNNDKKVREVTGQLWHSGILLGEGTIKASKFPYRKISCNFYIDNGNLYKDFNEKLLNENDFGGYKPWVHKAEYNYALDDFLLYTIQNDNYFKGTVEEGREGLWGKHQNFYDNNAFQFSPNVPSIITPFPLLWRTLNALFINKGFRYYDSFFSQGDYRAINIFNTVNAVEPEVYESLGDEYTRNVLTRYNIANHLPHIPTGEFIKAVQNFFNVKFYVRGFQVQVIDRLQLIQNTGFDDLDKKAVGRYSKELTGASFDGVAIKLERDGNDSNVGNVPTLPDGFVSETGINPVLPSMPIEPYPYALLFYKQSNQKGTYYQYLNERDRVPGSVNDYWYWWPGIEGIQYSSEELTFNEQESFYLQNRGFEININLSSVPKYILDGFGPTPYTYYKPKVLQKGNSYQHSIFNPFTLRLMMYQGIQSDVDGATMPLGSIKRNNISITSAWSYYNRWNEYLIWWNEAQKEKYEQNFQLSASEIKNFDFSRKKLINGNLFFITEMSVQLTRTEIKPAKCKMIKAQ